MSLCHIRFNGSCRDSSDYSVSFSLFIEWNYNNIVSVTVVQGILVETLPMPYRDEIKGLSKASGLNLGKLEASS